MIFDVLILITLTAAVAGYAIGFFAQRKFDRGLAPVVLLLLANGLLGVLFREDPRTDAILPGCSLALSVCAAASTSWAFARRHVVALPSSIVLSLAGAFIWLEIWGNYVCRTGGGAPHSIPQE